MEIVEVLDARAIDHGNDFSVLPNTAALTTGILAATTTTH